MAPSLSPTTIPALPVYDDRADMAEELTTAHLRLVQQDAALARAERLAKSCGVSPDEWKRIVWGLS